LMYNGTCDCLVSIQSTHDAVLRVRKDAAIRFRSSEVPMTIMEA
jgi:hypothetical protein